MKSTRDTTNLKRGGMPQYNDSQRSRNRSSSEKVRKRSDKLKDGVMPQCRIVTNIRQNLTKQNTLGYAQ